MNLKRIGLITLGLLFTMSAYGATTINTDKDKLSYGLGMMIGEQVLKQYGEVDYDILLEGMKAQSEGKETLMTLEDAGAALAKSQQEMNEAKFAEVKEKGAKYLEQNATQDGVTVTDSGLQYTVITQATVPNLKRPIQCQFIIAVHYSMALNLIAPTHVMNPLLLV